MTSKPQNLFFRIILLASLCVVAMFSMDMFLPSLPSIGKTFHASQDALQFTVTLYMFTIGLGQLFLGPVIDTYGRRKVAMIGLVIYFLGTSLAMLSPSINILIVARVIQAIGGCSLFVIAFASIRDIEDEVLRTKAISYLSMTTSISPILAPIVGATIEVHFGWRMNFVLMLAMSVLAGIALYFRLPNAPETHHKTQELSTLKKYELVITNRYFWQYTICLVSAFIPLITFISASAYLLMEMLKLSPHGFSIAFGANASMIFFGNYLSIQARKILSTTQCLYVGASIMLLGGLLFLMFTLLNAITLWTLMSSIIIASLGCVIALPVANAALMSPFPHLSGTAAGISNSLRMSVSSIVSVIITILITPYLIAYPLLLVCCALIVFIAAAKGQHLNNSPVTIKG